MTDLPMVPKHAAGKSRQPFSKEEMAKMLQYLEQLEAVLHQRGDTADPAELDKIRRHIASISAMLSPEKPASQTPRSLPPASDSAAVNSKIDIGGDVLPGTQIGSGTLIAGKIAGRHVVEANVFIDKVDNFVHPGGSTDLMTPDSFTSGTTLERTYLIRLAQLANRVPLGQLEIRAAGTSETMPQIYLDQIYVSLETTQTQPAVGEGKTGAVVQVAVLAAAISHPRLVILGDPGSGKTTFINYLTLCLAQACLDAKRYPLDRLSVPGGNGQRAARWRRGALIPIRVELREFAQHINAASEQGTCEMIWKFVAEHLSAHGLSEFAPQLKRSLTEGKCIVMFDGLDEVSDAERRKIVREAVTDFADTYSDSRMIVTCRQLSYTDPAWQLSSFPEAILAPLGSASIDMFIDAWYGTLARLSYLDRQHAAAKAAQLRRAAARLFDLAQNPMLLTVMAVVHTYKGTLPRERARLYNDCVELLLWNWQRHKQTGPSTWELGILHELNTREERLVNGLCEVAYHAHETQGAGIGGPTNIAEKEVVSILKDYLDNDFGKAQRFCQYVEKEAGLLIGKGNDPKGQRMYAFPHRGFQEFLAARYLVSDRDFRRKMKELVLQGDTWREVVLLAIGHLVFNQQEITRPLDAIDLLCKQETPANEAEWRAVWLSGEMVHIVGRSTAEGDKDVGRALVPRVVSQLAMLVTGGHLTAIERAQAGDILGLLGDSRPGVGTVVPDMIGIDGGPVEIGPDDQRSSVTLKPFMIGRYPVTNAQYRVFVEDEGYFKKQYWSAKGWGWREQTGPHRGLLDDPVWGIDNRPVSGITWYEAVAYCNWLAERTSRPVRLPTEAEWECTAAGMERRRYPWGGRASDDTANHRETGIGQTTAVGAFPADCTPEGVNDLGGNVWEWCSSLALEYPYNPKDGRENLDADGARILRGGGYDSPRSTLACTYRRPVDPHARVSMIGFRIASDALK